MAKKDDLVAVDVILMYLNVSIGCIYDEVQKLYQGPQ